MSAVLVTEPLVPQALELVAEILRNLIPPAGEHGLHEPVLVADFIDGDGRLVGVTKAGVLVYVIKEVGGVFSVQRGEPLINVPQPFGAPAGLRLRNTGAPCLAVARVGEDVIISGLESDAGTVERHVQAQAFALEAVNRVVELVYDGIIALAVGGEVTGVVAVRVNQAGVIKVHSDGVEAEAPNALGDVADFRACPARLVNNVHPPEAHALIPAVEVAVTDGDKFAAGPRRRDGRCTESNHSHERKPRVRQGGIPPFTAAGSKHITIIINCAAPEPGANPL